MADRRSTNAKLTAIINSKNSDKEDEEAILRNELNAKLRLRRASLYGFGARAKIPKLKRVKHAESSPFTVSAPITDGEDPKTLVTSIPPGSHADMYRFVT